MIVDVTGIELLPGNNGIDCKGNGDTEMKKEALLNVVVMNVIILCVAYLTLIEIAKVV